MKRLPLLVVLLIGTTWLYSANPNVPTTSQIPIINENPGKDFDFTIIGLRTGTLTIKVRLPKNEDAYIYFEDKSGIPVSSRKIRLQESEDFINLDISDLPNNSYRLTMASGSRKISKTILIPK
jgi:hypothetical protein